MTSVRSNCLCWRLQILTLGENPTPEYWFGDFVDFCWNDENTGEHHCETGIVVGVAWSQEAREWQYIVTWLSSTLEFSDDHYPIFSEEFVPEEVLCRP